MTRVWEGKGVPPRQVAFHTSYSPSVFYKCKQQFGTKDKYFPGTHVYDSNRNSNLTSEYLSSLSYHVMWRCYRATICDKIYITGQLYYFSNTFTSRKRVINASDISNCACAKRSSSTLDNSRVQGAILLHSHIHWRLAVSSIKYVTRH